MGGVGPGGLPGVGSSGLSGTWVCEVEHRAKLGGVGHEAIWEPAPMREDIEKGAPERAPYERNCVCRYLYMALILPHLLGSMAFPHDPQP